MRPSALTLCDKILLLSEAIDVGAEDQPQIDCSGGGASTAEHQYCSEQALDKLDEELNAAYRQALKKQAEFDREFAEGDKNLAGAVESLKKAQRIWIQFRDAHCDTVGYEAHGGTMLGSLLMDCKTEMTDSRIKQLKALIKGSEEE